MWCARHIFATVPETGQVWGFALAFLRSFRFYISYRWGSILSLCYVSSSYAIKITCPEESFTLVASTPQEKVRSLMFVSIIHLSQLASYSKWASLLHFVSRDLALSLILHYNSTAKGRQQLFYLLFWLSNTATTDWQWKTNVPIC